MTTPLDPNASKALRGGRYTLVRKLGEGSQGETYEAIDQGVGPEALQRAARGAPLVDKWARYVREQKSGGDVPQDARLVAIKCFRVGTAKAWKDVELAEREARTLASLDHPHLPRYFAHFEEDGALYLVMEKIEGESLASLQKSSRAMSVAEITRMLEDIGGALRYLHGRAPAVVHRDIKPGNIIRRPDGSFALVDFGAVRDRLRPAGGSTVVGTFGFMAPEQFQGRASSASDVYGLGATALTMLTGTAPEDLPHEGLGIVETRIAQMVTEKIDEARKTGLGAETEATPVAPMLDVAGVIDRSKPVTASEASQPRAGLSVDDGVKLLAERRAALRQTVVAADGLALGSVEASHPRLGTLNVYQWLLFLAGHEGRHTDQIREVARSL